MTACVAFSASRYLNENLMPFLRGAYTEDAGSLLQKSLCPVWAGNRPRGGRRQGSSANGGYRPGTDLYTPKKCCRKNSAGKG
jgi:hypothetical protein